MTNENRTKELLLMAFQSLSMAEDMLLEDGLEVQARKVRKALTQLHELREGNFKNVQPKGKK